MERSTVDASKRTLERERRDSGDDPLAIFESSRPELLRFCYRMLGSSVDAQEAVAETGARVWVGAGGFNGQASARTWIFRIATNVCRNSLRSRSRRALPMDLQGPTPASAVVADSLPEMRWISPLAHDPATIAVERDTIRLAFVAALQLLPARQRAVLVLRDVLGFRATEVASVLDTSVAAVNSALQRARDTLGDEMLEEDRHNPALISNQELLAAYVEAFERYDIDRLVGLLRADAFLSMPPIPMWVRGADEIGRFLVGVGAACRGSRLIPAHANGAPAFGVYRVDPQGGHRFWALDVLECERNTIAGIHAFLAVTPADFGLPSGLE